MRIEKAVQVTVTNVLAENIKAGVEILGVTGGYETPLTGDAAAGDVLASKTFYKDSATTKLTGTLALTGDAVVGNVLSGKTFYKDDAKTKLTGNMANNAGDVAAAYFHAAGPSLHVVPAAGYTDGVDDAAVITDAAFLAENIKAGVTIFGVLGTYEGA